MSFFVTNRTFPNPPFPRTFSIVNALMFIDLEANLSQVGSVFKRGSFHEFLYELLDHLGFSYDSLQPIFIFPYACSSIVLI